MKGGEDVAKYGVINQTKKSGKYAGMCHIAIAGPEEGPVWREKLQEAAEGVGLDSMADFGRVMIDFALTDEGRLAITSFLDGAGPN